MLPIQQCIMGFSLFFSFFTQSYKRQDWTPLHVKTAAHVRHWPAKEVDFMQNLKKGMGPQMKPVRHHANKWAARAEEGRPPPSQTRSSNPSS